MSSSMDEFKILKYFKVGSHAPKAPTIEQVDQHPPSRGWIKCNKDGAAKGSPSYVGCWGIFGDSSGAVLGCFSSNIGVSSALNAELSGAMLAIELAYANHWHKLWLECDSILVIAATKSHDLVPLSLRSGWKNCMVIL